MLNKPKPGPETAPQAPENTADLLDDLSSEVGAEIDPEVLKAQYMEFLSVLKTKLKDAPVPLKGESFLSWVNPFGPDEFIETYHEQIIRDKEADTYTQLLIGNAVNAKGKLFWKTELGNSIIAYFTVRTPINKDGKRLWRLTKDFHVNYHNGAKDRPDGLEWGYYKSVSN